ncbi:DsbA family oxidoreductase [Paenibacillus sacheonensis]|uniref:Thioredoxin domain-containing protein n=1 Tax=Paenibacillus sacheonensis TaxID=742054 RepID=A0A7X4YQ29_9BACL|nr:DsbA family oxidoreductase [Paenibacillus sacheonensis]MBM7566270.1 putative DsbA family dithiol-disulfide isomerase [Paenibacillus sacheonensis]NBC70477.1 thioredoxin domain-containing protein [Paenibacillus sacheonensis]
MNDVKIDVFMDIVCPWCRMGDASLRTALRELPADTKVTVRYHAYQLNPGIRKEGEDYRKVMIGRLGGEAQFEARMKQYNQTGAQFGLNYNMELVNYTPNTVLAHQLIAIAPEELKSQLIEQLYTAYFEQGANLGDVDKLVEIAQANGVANDPAALKMRLLQGEGREQVEEGQRDAQKLGIRGVPYYIVNDKYALSGLQSPADWLQTFKQV